MAGPDAITDPTAAKLAAKEAELETFRPQLQQTDQVLKVQPEKMQSSANYLCPKCNARYTTEASL